MSSFRKKRNENEEKVKLTKASYQKAKRLFGYLKPYRVKFSVGMLFLLLSSVAGLVFPMLLGSLFGGGPEAGDSTDVINLNQFSNNDIAMMLFVLLAANALFSFFRIYVVSDVVERMLVKVRADTYQHLIRLPMQFFSQRRVGELNSRVSADIGMIQDTMNTTLPEFIRQIIIILGGCTLLLILSPKLALIMMASLPVIIIFAVIFGKFIKKLSKQAQSDVAESNTIVEETLTGISNVKAFVNEFYEVVRYRKSIESIRKVTMKAATWRAAFASFIILFIFGAVVLVIWQGSQMVADPTSGLTQREFGAFILYTVFIGASFGGVSDLYAKIQKTIGATEELMDILDEEPEAVDLDEKLQISAPLKGRIRFDDISFTYPSRAEVEVLHNLSFNIDAGEQVAVVGPSGAGKSTLVSLLLRFYDPASGQLLFDEKPATEYDLRTLRQQMAVVPQEVLLFGGTIGENIAYGKPDASQEEIAEAAKKANALEFIEGFPDGYDTLVGERGIQLSGGQRQRIAIARAVLKDPAILILDEATSSLDSESERLVQEALEKLMHGRTSFVIAHRLSTIRKANKILVMDHGKLTEQGTHEELMNVKDGLYANLVHLQFDSGTVSENQPA
jgi:ABC-type multidrug transport system fused ATPase/permease subunit